MARQSTALLAGVPTPVPIAGRMLQIVSTGALSAVNVAVVWGPGDVEDFGALENTAKFKVEGKAFEGLIFTAVGGGTTVDYIISDSDVSITGGRGSSPAFPLYVSGALLGDTPASSASYLGPAIAVTAVDAIVAAANVNRLEARITNTGANNVAIGFAGLTWANASNVLKPGDEWIETKGAALAIHAICDAGKASTINIEAMMA